MRTRRILRVLVVAAGIVLMLLLAIFALLHTRFAQDMALAQIQKLLAGRDIAIEAENFSYSFRPLHVSTGRISIRKTSAPGLPYFFQADRLEASIRFNDLWKGRYWIDGIQLENPFIHVVIDEQHQDNIPGPSGNPAASTRPLDLLILQLRATGGRFAFEDRSRDFAVQLPAWDLSVHATGLNDSEEFQLNTRAISEIRYAAKTMSIDSVEAQGTLKQANTTLDLRSVRLTSALTDLTLNGSIGKLSDPQLNLSMVGDVHLKPARQFLSVEQEIEGDLHLESTLTGRPKELRWNGRVEGRDLTIDRFRRVSLDAGMETDLSAQRIRLISIHARSPNLTANGNADFALAPAAGESRVSATVDAPDLHRLLEMFKIPVSVASRATGDVRARWPGSDIAKMNGSGRIQLFERPALTPTDIPVSGVIDVHARGTRLTAVIQEIVSGALRLSGEVGIQPQNKISGTLRVDVSDTGNALPQVAGWVGSEIPADLHLSGPAVIHANLDGTLKAPQIGATVEATGLKLNSLSNIRVDATAQYTPELFDVPQLSIQWDADSVTGSGRIGLTEDEASLDGQVAMSNASIQRILAAAGHPEVSATGRLDVEAVLSGTVKDPVITAKVSGSDLQAYNEPLGTVTASAIFQNQAVLLDSLVLHKAGGGELTGSGRYDLAAREYVVELKGDDLQLKGITLPQGTFIRGDVSLTAEGRGTPDNPGGTLKLSSRDLHVNDQDLRTVELQAVVADHQAKVQASAPFFGVKADATVGIQQPYPAVVDLRLDDTDISRFPTDTLRELSGRVTAVLNAAGDLSDIEGGTVRADIPQLKLIWRGREITNDPAIQLSYAHRELTVTQAGLRFNDSTARFSGNIPLDGSSGELNVQGSVSLADLASLVPSEDPITAQGQLMLDGKLRGSLKRLDPDMTIAITNGSVESSQLVAPLSETTLKAVARDGRVVLEQFTGFWGAAKVTAQGEATLALLPELPIEIPRPDSPTRFTVNVDQFKLSSMTHPPPNTDGTISVRIEAQAQKPDINSVQLQVSFPDLRFNAGTFVLQQVGESSIQIRNGVASIGKFELAGPQTNIKLFGTADLRKSGPLALELKGETDAAVLALFGKAARGIGTASLSVDLGGTVQAPLLNGYLELEDGQAQLDSPRLAAENIQVRLDLHGERIDVTRLEGTVNGGTMQGVGYMSISGTKRGEMKLDVSGEGIYMEFPRGLKTISNARFRLGGTYPEMVISGNIDVEEGAYTEPLTVGRGLMKFFSDDTGSMYVVDDSADVKDTRLDIALRTLAPISVNNNIAQGEIDAELRLLGTIAEPGLTGKIEVDEGGRLYLRERRYSVDRGLITFNNEHAIEPVLDISATTTAKGQSSDYDITMKISGDVTRKLETDLTSSPPLDESDIVSVLATGRTKDQATSQGADVAKEQVLSFLAGDLGSSFASEAGRAIGLSQVRIDPNSIGSSNKSSSSSSTGTTSNPVDIANETDPKARLTLAKDITPQLSLIYSMNLQDSSDQMWVAEYNITRRVTTSAIMQDDNSFRVQAQHDLMFGLPGAPTKGATPVKRRIGSIQFAGDTNLSQEKLSKTAGLKTGKTYDFFSVQTARERLEKALRSDGRLESRISIERKPEGTTVDLVFHILEGPQVRLVFDGWDVSDDLKSDVQAAWSNGVIDIQRIDDAQDVIESTLIKERYSGFHVDTAIDTSIPSIKTVVFKIQPGMQYEELRAGFEGVRSVKESELQAILQAGGYFKQGSREREQAIPAIENFYRERGFIDVKVEPPTNRMDESTRTMTTVFHVTEGGLYHFGEVSFQGNAEFTSEALLMKIKIGPETVFQLPAATKARQTLQELYRNTGYNNSIIQFSQFKNADRRIVDVIFNIQEGLQRIVQEIVVEGNQKTTKGLVRSQTFLEQGDILSDEKLSKARTNLYDSGAFAFVDIEVVPVEPAIPLKPNQVPVLVMTRVREVKPWELKYGGYLDSNRGPGLITDFSNRNMLGNARVLGMQVRYDGDLQEARMYFSQPVLRRFPVKSLLSGFKSHEEVTDDQTGRTTITDREGLSPSFEYKFRKVNTVSLGYRLEMTHQYTAVPDPLFPDSRARTAPITSSITRDTRDDPFDASYGHFTSHSVDWGTSTLGSDLHYVKYFAQYFDYLRLGKPSVVPWTRQLRNRILLAFGARVGLLNGKPGQDFRTEQFKTGGGTTVRGFQQDRLGPLDADGNPTGGDAELVLNSEFRFPLYKFFDGVAFVDAGNVYPRLQDFSPFDVRASYGFGVRIRTPYLLLRFDYGINMNPKPGEPKGQFFFSFGQAF